MHKAYNDETLPPYGLPDNKTQSAMQSSTSPGGGSANELRLQDANDSMQWFLHASRDLRVQVAHDENETIGVDSDETAGATYQTSVGGAESTSIGGDQSVTVAASPFDRRHRMASVLVDTAAGGGLRARLEVPFLDASVARQVADRLAADAAATRFEW